MLTLIARLFPSLAPVPAAEVPGSYVVTIRGESLGFAYMRSVTVWGLSEGVAVSSALVGGGSLVSSVLVVV